MQWSNHVGRDRREDLSPVRLNYLGAFRARRRQNLQEAAGIATISRNFRYAVWGACLAHLLLEVSPIDKGSKSCQPSLRLRQAYENRSTNHFSFRSWSLCCW